MQFSRQRKISFTCSFPPRRCGIATFTSDLVIGAIHPENVREQGHSYRNKLQNLVVASGLENNVIFHNHFVSNAELNDFLAATDIYVTSYLNKEQLTSGTQAFAVGCGKAIISTPYWAAEELLADGRGVLVPLGEAQRIAEDINKLLGNDSLLNCIKQRAYDYGRAITWPWIGRLYRGILTVYKPLLCASVLPQLTLRTCVKAVVNSLKAPAAIGKTSYLKASCF
jgi:glycosyltransferase involved in cell wall biosynthesis